VARSLRLLIGGSLFLAVAVLVPAARLGEPEYLTEGAAALALCLVPAVATLILAHWAGRKRPAEATLWHLAGTAIRMFVVLFGGLLLANVVPAFVGRMSFWMWIAFFYLTTLALEVTLIVTQAPAVERPPQP
jgi:hypothetical protein